MTTKEGLTEHAIGIMSGTSVDGIDLALIAVTWRGEVGGPGIEPIAHMRASFASDLRRRILALASGEPLGAADVARLHGELGDAYADAALALVAASPATPTVIGVHGQTVAHLPAEGVTLQLGDAARVAFRTGIASVSDFRSADVAAGGEGAPLTPFADHLLFSADHPPRAVVNLGGIANVTLLPDRDPANVRGFDTGPGNMLIDSIARTQGADLDPDGVGARRGRVVAAALDRALAHPFFARRPPKSAGREEFGYELAGALLADVRAAGGSIDDALATATELTARTVTDALKESGETLEVLVAGGGTRNTTLMDALARALAPSSVRTTDALGVPAAAREAIAFALLALYRWHDLPNTLPACTGASRAVSAGALHEP